MVLVRSICQSPRSRLRRQRGVIEAVTARAVNIAGFQFITLIRHLMHNRASGCNINNPALTASEAMPATWGKPMNPRDNNRGAVADSANEGNSRPVRRFRGVGGPWVTLRSPTAKSLRLTPPGSRLSGDMAAEVCNRAARLILLAIFGERVIVGS